MVNDAFMEALNGLVAQMDAQAGQSGQAGNTEAKKLAEKLQTIYKVALKFSMKKKMA